MSPTIDFLFLLHNMMFVCYRFCDLTFHFSMQIHEKFYDLWHITLHIVVLHFQIKNDRYLILLIST